MSEVTQPETSEGPVKVKPGKTEKGSDVSEVRSSFTPQQRLLILDIWDRSKLPAREIKATRRRTRETRSVNRQSS